MAKTAAAKPKAGAGKKTAKKKASAKAPTKAAAKPRKASAGKAKPEPKPTQARQRASGDRQPPHGAADAVIKLLESPLVVDLIAVGATAALAAIAEKRFGRRDDDQAASRSAIKAAGKAAAAAMGRRIASEAEEIMKASKAPKGGAKS